MSVSPLPRLIPSFTLRPTSPFIAALAAAAERRAESPLQQPAIARVEAPERGEAAGGAHGNPRR